VQVAQTRFAEAVPSVARNCPAPHVDQAAHVAVFGPALQVPAVHAPQVRSVIVVPAMVTELPAPHVLHAVHTSALTVVE
jgi:hypothetical protein